MSQPGRCVPFVHGASVRMLDNALDYEYRVVCGHNFQWCHLMYATEINSVQHCMTLLLGFLL